MSPKLWIFAITLIFSALSLSAQPNKIAYHPQKVFIKISQTAARATSLPLNATSAINIPNVDRILSRNGLVEVRPLYDLSNSNRAGQNLYGLDRVFVVEFEQPIDVISIVGQLSNEIEIEYAEPVYHRELVYQPNDSLLDVSWHHTNVQSEAAWDVTTGSDSVLIAILDTGVDTDHPDLIDNFYLNPGEIPDNGIDDDLNGYVDDTLGWDFSGTESNPTPDNNVNHDWNWHPYHAEDHGTHCAGIAAGVGDNEIGIVGVAFHSKIMPIKIFPNSYDDVITAAMMYVADNGADIMSCSWGGGPNSSTLNSAILYARDTKNCLVIAAAGNDGSSSIFYPAGSPGVLSVGATTGSDARASFSNYGNWVDLCAPGAGIWSTTDPANPFHSDLYQAWDGTSMACPMVAGVAALVRSQFPNLSIDEQEALLIDGDDVGNIQMGKRINAFKAVTPFRITHIPLTESEANLPISVEADVLAPGLNLELIRIYYSIDSAPFEFVEMSETTTDHWVGTIPLQEAGTVVQYYLMASDSTQFTVFSPPGAPAVTYMFLVGGIDSFLALINDNVETNLDWMLGVPEDNASSGTWEWGNPNGTWQNSTPVQPEDDHTLNGENCFFTGQAPASSTNNGAADVDGGRTTLRSPFWNFPAGVMPILTYYRWYTNAEGLSPGFDYWRVQVRSGAEGSWITLEETTESESAWVARTFYLPQYMSEFSNLQIQFIAEDLGGGSLVEAAVDDIKILTGNLDFYTPGDVNYDTLINIQDIVLIVNHIMEISPLTGNAVLAADYNQDGYVNVQDLVSLVNLIVSG